MLPTVHILVQIQHQDSQNLNLRRAFKTELEKRPVNGVCEFEILKVELMLFQVSLLLVVVVLETDDKSNFDQLQQQLPIGNL